MDLVTANTPLQNSAGLVSYLARNVGGSETDPAGHVSKARTNLS
jgi:hypothetical protein